MGNFQKFLLLEIRYNLYFADNSVKLLAFLVMQCLWCIFFNVLLLKCIPLSLVFLKQLFPQAQVSFLVFNSKYSKARVFVFCGEGECESDLCSWGYVGIQPVWEVRGSHQVIQLHHQISSMKIFDKLFQYTDFSKSHCARQPHV